jgi:hypothetical protein
VRKEFPDLSAGIQDRLDAVSWDFADARTNGGPHGIHPYPAKFIPQLPRTLIDLLHPGDASAVLDPFCGSGTTLVEAYAAGLPSIGIDLHPLATLPAAAVGPIIRLSRDTTRIFAAEVGIANMSLPTDTIVTLRFRRHGRGQYPDCPRAVTPFFHKAVAEQATFQYKRAKSQTH